MKKLSVCSLKYAPGLAKEFFLLGDKFAENGFDVSYLLSEGYSTVAKGRKEVRFVINGKNSREMMKEMLLFPFYLFRFAKSIKSKSKGAYYLFYNPHPLQPLVILMLRLFYRSHAVLVLHEPSKSVSDLKKHGLAGFFYFGFAMLIQQVAVCLSSYVVTMSPYGEKLFLNHFPKAKKKHINANLLLPKGTLNKGFSKAGFSFIGNVNRGKNLDDIIVCVNDILTGNLEPCNFNVITSSNIETELGRLKKGWQKYLSIVNKEMITDEMISEVVSSSVAVLVLHRTASQSGVLPLAFSLSTPVIVRDLPAFTQYVDEAGIVLTEGFDSNELISACKQIEKNYKVYSQAAEMKFNECFSENQFTNFYARLLGTA